MLDRRLVRTAGPLADVFAGDRTESLLMFSSVNATMQSRDEEPIQSTHTARTGHGGFTSHVPRPIRHRRVFSIPAVERGGYAQLERLNMRGDTTSTVRLHGGGRALELRCGGHSRSAPSCSRSNSPNGSLRSVLGDQLPTDLPGDLRDARGLPHEHHAHRAGHRRYPTSHASVSVTASAIATLDEMFPGRVLAGVGTGFSSLRTIGMAAPSQRNWKGSSSA